MLRRVTTLAALGERSPRPSGSPGETSVRHRLGTSFTELGRRRRVRSSACASLVGLSWNFDPPATVQQPDKLAPYDFDQNALNA